MPGGLFAIDKSFFQDIGFYDPGLEVWGSDNIEVSFKVHYRIEKLTGLSSIQ